MRFYNRENEIAELRRIRNLSFPHKSRMWEMGMPQTNNQQTTSANWIEVGTVIGDCYRDGRTWYLTGPKELKLYVLYLGEKLIYRVEWNGKSYPVVHNNNSSSYNASASIPGWVYRYKTTGDHTSGKITDEAKVLFNVPTW